MKRDFYAYYTNVQKQYNEMAKVLEKVNKELSEGKCTQEQRDNFERYFNNIQVNYERLSYVRHLLTLPPKFIQKLEEKRILKRQEKEAIDFSEIATEEAVLAENQENLDKINDQLSEINPEGDTKDGD